MAETAVVRSQTSPGRPKIAFLEAVRGVASIIVVLQHILAAQMPGFETWSREYIDFGRVGVVAFFVVSGYVIPLSLERQSPRVFVIRRLFRLFPLYWLTLAAFLVFALLVPSTAEVNVTPIILMINVLMIQGILPIVTIVPTAWTLGIELVFYAQTFIAKLVGQMNRAVYLGYVWLGLFAVVQVACRVLDRDLPTTPMILLYTAALGHALFLKDQHGSAAWKPLLAAGIIVVPVFTSIGGDHDPQWPPFTYAASYLLGLALFFAFYRFTKATVHPILIWLGAVSYAIYLIHPLVYRLVNATGANSVIVIVISVGLTLVVAWLLHRFVELPFIAIGRRLSSTRTTPPSS